jgi:anti-sigma B factor antagonist
MLMTITPTEEPGTYRLEGELDLTGEQALATALEEAIAAHGEVRLDLSGLTFMDSTGLRVLLSTAASRNGAGPIVLLHPTRAVRHLLDIALPDGAPGLEVQE